MSIPITVGIGNTRWKQNEGEVGLEIRIPMTLLGNARPRNLAVEIKDTTVLCISHNDSRMIQWRLYEPVTSEVEWRVEGSTLVVELEKKSAKMWNSLLDLPMRDDDPLFTPIEEINRMFLEQLPSLPPPSDDGEDVSDSNEDPTKEVENIELREALDFDKLLEEAAAEVTSENKDIEDTFRTFIKSELMNFRLEKMEIKKKMHEVDTQLKSPFNENIHTYIKQKKILDKMLRLHNQCRELRSRPNSLENFIRCTQLELQKSRVNIGELNETETEEYGSEDEKTLSDSELLTRGLRFLQERDVSTCLHFLRLAAIEHQHDESILLLYSIYTQLGSPRGAFLLLNRALDDKNPSAAVRQKVGELYDKGARHFLPLFPMALYFYESSARLGNVTAMLNVAQLWQRGDTESSILSVEHMEAQKNIAKYSSWLDRAMDRGCGATYFVRACMYLKGDYGCEKSYEKAKEYLDATSDTQPELIKNVPLIWTMLEQLKEENASQQTLPSSSGNGHNTTAPKTLSSMPEMEDDEVQVSSSVARLNALSKFSTTATSAGPVHRTKKVMGESARRRVFWERSCIMGVSLYGLYTLAFPLRILILPFFYSFMESIVAVIPWLSNAQGDMSLL